jgi:general L-amino acid transport system substrate-binding protein
MIPGGSRFLRAAFVVWTALLACASPASADRGVLEAVRARGYVVCGVGDGPKGFSAVNAQGVWSGIGVDFCRALAAAVIGTKDAVKFRMISSGDGFAALQAGEIDVLSRNIAMSWSRDTSLGVRFPAVLVHDGQGFMARKSQNITSALELSGARICVTGEGSDEQGLTDYFASLRIAAELVKFAKWSDAVMAYVNKSCMVLSADVSVLALARQDMPDGNDHAILPEMVTRQPIGPAVRQADDEWFNIVRWTVYALVAAEELGIGAANVDAARSSNSSDIRRFLGVEADLGRSLGLSADWTQRVVRQMGNYGEMFERNLGQKSPLRVERRLNNLVSKGGLQMSPPFR